MNFVVEPIDGVILHETWQNEGMWSSRRMLWACELRLSRRYTIKPCTWLYRLMWTFFYRTSCSCSSTCISGPVLYYIANASINKDLMDLHWKQQNPFKMSFLNDSGYRKAIGKEFGLALTKPCCCSSSLLLIKLFKVLWLHDPAWWPHSHYSTDFCS